jgi:hypothetical protein
MALPALHHAGQNGAGGVHVGHDVDPPRPLPVGVGAQLTAGGHTGVGAPQVDPALVALQARDQVAHRRLVGHVQVYAEPAVDAAGHRPRPRRVQVGHHDHARPLGGEPLGERPADATGRAGDDGDGVLQHAAPSPDVTPRKHAPDVQYTSGPPTREPAVDGGA